MASAYTVPVTFKLPDNDKAAANKPANQFDEIVVVGYGRNADNSKTVTIRNSDLKGPNAPVVTVDGKKTTDIDNIDPETIESITVYKEKPEYPNGYIEIKLKH